VSGDALFVGAPYKNNGGTNRGSIFKFTRSGSTWTQSDELTSSTDNYYFGFSCHTDGTRLIVGAPGVKSSGFGGRAYVYTLANFPTEEDNFIGSSTSTGDEFGYSVSIDGSTCAVGAEYGDGLGTKQGEWYAFTESGGVWTQESGPNTSQTVSRGGAVGFSIAVKGDTIAVGHKNSDWSAFPDGGQVDVWNRSGVTWSRTQQLKASDASSSDAFGDCVLLIDESTLYIGALGCGTQAGGALYKFELNGSWTETDQRFWSTALAGNGWCTSIAESGGILVAGGSNIAGTTYGGHKIYDVGPFTTPILECLHPPEEESSKLNLGTMDTSISAIDLVLEDIPDTDGNSYFGKLFAPGRWDTGVAKPTVNATGYNQYIRCNDTTISLKSAVGMWAAPGVGHIGGEVFSFTGIAVNDLTGVQKGLYSCTEKGGYWGQSYKQAYQGGETSPYVSEYAYGWGGRRIALYITCIDPTTGIPYEEGQEELLWIGRIATDELTIVQEGPTSRWRLACVPLLAELQQRKLATDMPEAKLGPYINLQGEKGRKFVIHEWDEAGTWEAVGAAEVAKGVYTLEELLTAMTTALNGASWTNQDGSHYSNIIWHVGYAPGNKGVQIGADLRTGGGSQPDWRRFVIDADSPGTAGLESDFCHALNALGFDGWSEHEFEIPADGSNKPRWGYVQSDGPAFQAYHPLVPSHNGFRLYIESDAEDKDPFWPVTGGLANGQGDGTFDLGHVRIRDSVLDKVNDISGHYYVRYDDLDVATANKHYLNIAHILNLDYRNADLAIDAYVGSKLGEASAPALIQQVYVPFYTDGATYPRGPFEMMLYPLLSTGTPTYNHATYDQLPLALSLGVQASLVDIQSFLQADVEWMARGGDLAQRVLWPIEPGTSWIELMRAEAQLSGYVLRWKNGQIGLVNVLAPDTDGYDVTLDASVGAKPVQWPDLFMEMETVVNQYRIKSEHPISDDYPQTEFIFSDTISRDGYQVTKEVEVKHNGVELRDDGATMRDIFASGLIGRPLRFISPTCEVSLDRTMIRRVEVGDVVLCENARIMDPQGSGVFGVSVLATVLDRWWNYGAWRGNAALLLHSQYQSYGVPPAPSALVDIDASNGGWDNVNKRLTLKALHYGESGDPDDGAAFSDNDVLLIIERAPTNPDSPQSWQVTVDGVYEVDGAQLLTLDAGTTLTGWDSDKEYIVTFADWTNVQASQQTDGTWQADVDSELLDSGSGNDSPQRWG
jgi:hypothetical protein